MGLMKFSFLSTRTASLVYSAYCMCTCVAMEDSSQKHVVGLIFVAALALRKYLNAKNFMICDISHEKSKVSCTVMHFKCYLHDVVSLCQRKIGVGEAAALIKGQAGGYTVHTRD